MKAYYKKYTLHFKFEAGTSRGVLREKNTYFIYLVTPTLQLQGVGEANVLQGLSIDDTTDFEEKLKYILHQYNKNQLDRNILKKFPAIAFGLETAERSYHNRQKYTVYDTDFIKGKQSIPINGLIWMGKKSSMLSQIKEKIEAGFNCLKMKIGAIDFEEELSVLKSIRQTFSESDMTLRVDANGAFGSDEALEKLKRLSDFQLHSIEQPIAIRQYEAMASLCQLSPVPIALDEELIGIEEKTSLLQMIKPAFIVLKPALLGGFEACQTWIDLAEKQKVGWWVTSALESNIGLNAIAQWTSTLPYKGHQGLGTGQLYTNNISSPLVIEAGYLQYDTEKEWETPDIS